MTSVAWKGLAAGVAIGVVAVGGVMIARRAPSATPLAAVTVYKSASCGCCKLWVEYMREQGYSVITHDVEDLDRVLADNRVPSAMGSCHTALIGGYVVEGHVPVEDIKRLLAERPNIVGLSVPGMPNGAPGMGDSPQPYQVIAFDQNGGTRVYASH